MIREESFGFWKLLSIKEEIISWKEIRRDLVEVTLANGLQIHYRLTWNKKIDS